MRRELAHHQMLAIAALVLLAAAGAFAVWRYKTLSTLDSVEVMGFRGATEELCQGERQLWPSPQYPFRSWSPDGDYYVEVSKVWFWEANPRVLNMYSVTDGTPVGRYVSSDRSILILCWARDSSGIYVADYWPSGGSIFIIPPARASRVGDVKKVLIPSGG